MATNITVWWARDEELTAPKVCQLVMDGRAWDDAENVTGVWDSDANAYGFTFDVDGGDSFAYDPTKVYDIYEGEVGGSNSKVVEDWMIGDIQVAKDLDAHEGASTNVHGLAGGNAVVGLETTQTLKNKTLNCDTGGNVFVDVPGSALKAGTELPAVDIEPDATEDAILHLDVATAAGGFVVQSSNAAKTVDRKLTLIADDLELKDDAGNAIKLTGIDTPTDADGAATKAQIDALDTRLDNLEVGGVFGGSPEVVVRHRTVRRVVGASSLFISWRMADLANEGKVARWEVFWNSTGIPISAGVIDTDELMWLRQNCNRLLFRGEEGNACGIPSDERVVHFCVVAVDTTPVFIASDVQTVELWVAPGEGGEIFPMLDADGNLAVSAVKSSIGLPVMATIADANEAAAPITFEQTAATAEKIKWRCPITIGSDVRFIRINVYARATVADKTGLVTVRLVDAAASEVASAPLLLTYESSMPTIPQAIEMDVGAIAAGTYELRIGLATNEAGKKVEMTSMIGVDLIRKVSSY